MMKFKKTWVHLQYLTNIFLKTYLKGLNGSGLTAALLSSALLSSALPAYALEVGSLEEPVRVQVIKAASYVDTRSGALIRPAMIVVEQGRIRAINPKQLPVDAQVIDLGEATLLPGLIDVHTHLMVSTNDAAELVRQAGSYSETDFVLEGISNGYKTLMAGFTSVRDLDSWYFVDVTLSKNSDKAGFSLPRIVPAGHGINVSSPSDYSHIFPAVASLPQVGIAGDSAQLIEAVDHQAAMGVGVIKLYGSAGFTMSEYSDKPVGAQTYSDEQVQLVIDRARKHGLKVATHAHGSASIMASVQAGAASIEHGSLLTDKIIEAMKAQGTYLVPTTNIMNANSLNDPHLPPKAIEVIKRAIKSHQQAISAGVKIAYGTDSGLYPHGKNADGFRDLVAYGMSPAQALQSATVNAADLLGFDDRGVLASGMLADIIAVQGNPLEDIRRLENVSFVMKGGKVFKRPEVVL